eukprot:TRINITY_DN5014_c5_g1_i1.p1 TRINITY_DN5014_c5_g1~~TRINITY_DN5014_c5_g1_i1.p1  ORF type:complete len:862 (+),score=192.22 TRINITY_DN5014_c5_g1_i1:23-2587(+)
MKLHKPAIMMMMTTISLSKADEMAKLRLYGANTDAGRVDVLNSEGEWGTICWTSAWDMEKGNEICETLGFGNAVAAGEWHAGTELKYFTSMENQTEAVGCSSGASVACIAKGNEHPDPLGPQTLKNLKSAEKMFASPDITPQQCQPDTPFPSEHLIPTASLDEVYIYPEEVFKQFSKANDHLKSTADPVVLSRLATTANVRLNAVGIDFDRTQLSYEEAAPLHEYSALNQHKSVQTALDEPLRHGKDSTSELHRNGIEIVKDWGFSKQELDEIRDIAYSAIEKEDSKDTSVVSGGAIVTSRVRIPQVERFLENDSLISMVKSYLGDDAVVNGYKATRLTGALTDEGKYVASRWHHDRVGRRLKLFIFLHDIDCDEGRPTQVAIPTHDILYHRTESFPFSRYHDAWVRKEYNVTKACGSSGGGFIFDTHSIHKGTQEGSHNRTTIIIEFHNSAKCPFVTKHRLGLPCPSGDQRMLSRRLVQKKVLLPNGVPSDLDFQEGCSWRYLPGDVIPPVPPAAYLTSVTPKRGVCFYEGKQSTLHFDGVHGGGCELPDGGFTYGGFQLLLKEAPRVAPECGMTGDTLRRFSTEYLTEDNKKAFREVAGCEVGLLVDNIVERGDCFVSEVLSKRRFLPDELNSKGLHLFRCLLAEGMTDARRRASPELLEHPDYAEWNRNGFLLKNFDDVIQNGEQQLRSILRMASAGDTVQQDLSFVERLVTHVGQDTQYQAHVDTFHSVIKMWVYPSTVTLKEGPLHVLPGTHRNTLAKLKWMHHATQGNHTAASVMEESLRLAHPPSTFGLPEPNPAIPLPGVNLTIIIADTSSIHFRGYAAEGVTRVSMRPIGGENDGGMRRQTPFRE